MERFVDVRAVLDVLSVVQREEWRRDNFRIMTRQDVNLEALRRRMLHGSKPKVTMLEQVAPIWGARRW